MAAMALHPRVSVNMISSMNWTLQQDLAYYKQEGFGNVGLLYFKLTGMQPGGLAAAMDAIRAAKLRFSCMACDRADLVAMPLEGQPALAFYKPAIDTAAALGVPACYIVTGPIPKGMQTDEAYARLAATLTPVVAYAKSKGVRFALEHNSVSTRDNGFVHTLADAIWLSKECGIEICLELQNCWIERDLKRVFRDNLGRIPFVQFSDFKVGENLRYNRFVPGDGDIPLEWLVGTLLEVGYKGFFDLEVLGPKIEEEGYASAIRRSVDWLSERLTRWGA